MVEDLMKDPIINFYIKMSNSVDNNTPNDCLPVFSETMLRLAFKEVVGKLRPFDMLELSLYRRLLLYHYSDKYKSVDDLLKIMTCFNEDDINESFENPDLIIMEWHTFTRKYLSNILHRETFIEILYEWTRRFEYLYGKLDDNALALKTKEIQSLLDWDYKHIKQSLRVFKSKYSSTSFTKNNAKLKDISAEDLDIKLIYEDIKHKLNPWMCELISKNLSEEKTSNDDTTPPPFKKSKSNVYVYDIEVLENLKLQTNKDVESTKPTMEEANKLDECENNDSNDNQQPTELSDEDNNPDDDVNIQLVEILEADWDLSESEELEDAKKPQSKNQLTVDYDNAISHISDLIDYAVKNNHNKAVELLKRVELIFNENP